MESLRHSVAEGGQVEPDPQLSPRAAAILERIARCGYMIQQHREGIAPNSRRIAELEFALRRPERP